MPASMPVVCLLGDLNIDLLLEMDAYPRAGGDGMVEHYSLQQGGSAANTAVVLAHLGLPARLIARLGMDAWAETATASLKQAGVGLEWLQHDAQAATGLVVVPVTPDGDRTMFNYRGANTRLDPDAILPETMAGVGLLHLSGYAFLEPPQRDAAWKAVNLAKQTGTAISLDMGSEPARFLRGQASELLAGVELLSLNQDEARLLSGQEELDSAVQSLLACGVKTLALKLGRNGCALYRAEEQVTIDGFAVAAVDSTGAGDAFSAGMIYGLRLGWDLPLCGLLANALGALAATRWGAGPGLPTRLELMAFLRNQVDQGERLDLSRRVLRLLEDNHPWR